MRVLHVLPSVARSYGGPTQSLLGYVQASRAVGIELDVIAPRPSPEDIQWWRTQLPEQELTFFSSRGDGAFVFSPLLARWLWSQGARYDVVHIHGLQNPVSSVAARICVSRRWSFLIRPLGMLSEFTFEHRRRALKKLYWRWVDGPNLRHVSGLHFTTVGERDEGMRRVAGFGLASFVVPPPFSGDATAPKPSAHPRLLFLSRIHRVKNLESLLKSWALVVTRAPKAELVIAGDGDPAYMNELKALVEQLGISRSVTFSGFVSGQTKLDLLATAHAFALPSLHENFGVAVLEAIAAGIPSVLSREVHVAPFVAKHGLGIVVDGKDIDALADAVTRCLTDVALQGHCRTAGPQIVATHFSRETIGYELSSMYASVVELGQHGQHELQALTQSKRDCS